MVKLDQALSERYLIYALSTIMDRALPDVRDGLKPVQRRIIYAMIQLQLYHKQKFKKCARIIGDVTGKFHPHNEVSVYDALARMAQDFVMRYPLVDGQGNFGNIDGDNPAAMRYTEARMSEIAELLIANINQNAVDFIDTYDGENQEPTVLPASFPNVLANGSYGIAVGMATSIPPHNLLELFNASLALIDNPDITVNDVMQFIIGPDFPTGGIIVDDEQTILNAYKTGKGSLRLRARWHTEKINNRRWHIVITEIPYQVAKSKLIEKIAELITSRKLSMLVNVNDESAENIRIVLKPKNNDVEPEMLMRNLYQYSDLETRVQLNMNVLRAGKIPGLLNIKDILRQWLDHRLDVLNRCSSYRLRVIRQRLNILDGLLIAYLNLDEVIRIIRWEDQPKQKLITAFSLNDEQAEAILNTKLRALRQLEEMKIKDEHGKLTREMNHLTSLLANKAKQWQEIKQQIIDIKDKYQEIIKPRRTVIMPESKKLSADAVRQALVSEEPITVVLSAKGWLSTLKGHVSDYDKLNFKSGDRLEFTLHCQTTDKILLFSDHGRCFTSDADKLMSDKEQPIKLLFTIDATETIVDIFAFKSDSKMIIASQNGKGFIANTNLLLSTTKKGRQVFNLDDNDKLICIKPADGDTVAVIGNNRRLLIFPAQQIPVMARGKGVKLQRYKDKQVLSDVRMFELERGLTWHDTAGRAFNKSKKELELWLGNRGQVGKPAPHGFPRGNKFSG